MSSQQATSTSNILQATNQTPQDLKSTTGGLQGSVDLKRLYLCKLRLSVQFDALVIQSLIFNSTLSIFFTFEDYLILLLSMFKTIAKIYS